MLVPFTVNGQVNDGRTSLLPGISSPTAASLGEYGDIPVSLFTGTPNISIPLTELKGRMLSLPISLNYNGSGVRVEEIPGWAGLGWSLDAGGVITRTVRGLPDDREKGFFVEGGDSAAVHLQSSIPPHLNPSAKEYLEEIYYGNLDGEPDRFFFNFSGNSGQIFFDRDLNAQPFKYKPYVSPQKDIRIELQKNSYSNITAWILTTEDGTRYTFDETETTRLSSGRRELIYTSSWYLTKIESANGDDEIILTYESDGLVSVPQRNGQAFTTLRGSNVYDPCTPGSFIAEYPASTATKYLRRIETAQHKATFNRQSRTDGGGQRLSSIEIEQSKSSVRTHRFVLNHYYFNAGASEDYQRLRLDQIHQFDGATGELPSWGFSYDDSYDLPSRNSTSIDHWGYFNGRSNSEYWPKVTYEGVTYSGGNREPYERFALTGALTELTYPTGGKTEFTWEGHRYGENNTLGGGIRVKKIEHFDGMNPDNNVVLEYRYTKDSSPGESSGKLLRNPKVFNIHNFTQEYRSTPHGPAVTRICKYISRSSSSYIAPGMMQGSTIMYSEVTVLHGSEGENGKTITRFKVPDVTSNTTAWPFTPTVVESWRAGEIISSQDENSAGIIQKQRGFSYSSQNEKKVRGVVVGARLVATGVFGEKYQFMSNVYVVNTGAYFPQSETQRVYNSDGTDFMSSSIAYTRQNLPELVQITKKTEKNSNNSQRITEYVYAHKIDDDGKGIDYTPMETFNMLSEPYSVTVSDGSGNVLKKEWTLWRYDDARDRWMRDSEWVWAGGDPMVPIFEQNN